jgi:uroporphyrinogen III methyltransferase/synthase
LTGTTVVVTRPVDRAGGLVDALRSQGAEVVVLPVIAIEPVPLEADRADPATFDWVAFTSASGVRHFIGEGGDPSAFGSARLAAVGPATADALAVAGVAADLVAWVHTASGLCDSLVAAEPEGGRVLVPQAEAARPTLVDCLRAAGWSVEPVTVYRTVPASPTGDAVAAAATADVVTFASPSAHRAFLQLVGPEQMPPVVATIGPVTSDAVRAAGGDVDIEADPHSTAGLVDALVRWHRTRPRPD